jgi:hypothetical protein
MTPVSPRFLRRATGAFLFAAALYGPVAVGGAGTDRHTLRKPDLASRVHMRRAFSAMPMRFEPNVKDRADDVDFIARGSGYVAGVSASGAALILRQPSGSGAAIHIRLAHARRAAAGAGLDELPGRTNHLLGNDPRRWRTGVRGYAEVEYRDVYPGVNVVYYGNQQQLEYDFVVSPGANYRDVALVVDGAERLAVDAHGNLIITTLAGELTQHAPVIYQQQADGTRTSIDGGYVIRRGREVGFRVGKHDRRLPLVIDPVLSYSTFYGGSGSDYAINGLALDAQDNMYIAGETYSLDLPVVNGRPPVTAPTLFGDGFIAKLNAAGDALIYATYLGGSDIDAARDLEVDAAGNAYVVGSTSSSDFPTVHAIQSTLKGYSDAFVAKLDPTGAIVYSTYLGGNEMEAGYGVGFDAHGRAYVTGWTGSPDFPTANAPQPTLGSSPAFRTFDGGSTWTALRAGLSAKSTSSLAVDPWNTATLYAGTWPDGLFKSSDSGDTWMPSGAGLPAEVSALAIAPTWPATVFAATNAGVYRSTDDGASWTTVAAYDYATALAVDPVTPMTVYAGFAPTPSNYFAVHKSTDGGITWSNTGFLDLQYPAPVRALSISGSTVYAATDAGVYRSRSGGAWIHVGPFFSAHALVADPMDPSIVYAGTPDGVVRSTSSGDQWSPVMSGLQIDVLVMAPGAPWTVYAGGAFGAVVTNDGGEHWQPTGLHNPPISALAVDPQMPATIYAGSSLYSDAFVTVLGPDGSTLDYSTYVGGSNSDGGSDITVDATGNVYLVGTTWSADFPGINGAQMTLGGSADLFVMKLSPAGAIAYATYLGGSDFEDYGKIAVDGAGQAHVVGYTVSSDFPVVNAYDPTYGGNGDDVVTKLDASGSGFIYSTYLGGSDYEIQPGVAVTAAGTAFVTGPTKSSDFPLADPFHSAVSGFTEGFVTRFQPNGQVEYSTLIGGSGIDWPFRVAVDSSGSAVVAGVTASVDFPVQDAFQPVKAGPPDSYDGFISRITHTPTSDFTAPTTTIAVAGTAGLGGWYRTTVQITLSATDEGGSGVALTEYSVNGGAFQPYAGPFSVSAQGATQIQARSADHAGNLESPGAVAAVKIDSVAPVVTVATPQAANYLHSDTLTLSFAATDSLSGLATGSPSATLDGAAAMNGQTISLLTRPLGAHTFIASASDVAGNAGQQPVTFQLVATIDSLIAAVNTFAAQRKIDPSTQKSLLAKLNDAKQAFDRGNLIVVRNKLSDVITIVNTQTGKSIAADAANVLVTDTQYVLSAL